jgi:hypothetical protein
MHGSDFQQEIKSFIDESDEEPVLHLDREPVPGTRSLPKEGRRFIAELLARAFPDEGLRLPSRGARETRNFSKQAPSRPLKMLQFCTRVCDFPTEETSWSKKSGTIWIGFMYDTHECGVLCRVL